jgi:hypothetical protein
MPTYTYLCEISDQEFETEHSIKIKLEECPICKEKNLEQHVPKRLISGSTMGKVVLTGHELTAKTKEDIRGMKQRLQSDQNYHANIVGESTFNKMVK